MNDQERNELRVKVAELCGWKRIHYRTALADHWLPPGTEPEFPTDAVTGTMPFPRPHAEWEEPEDPLDYLPDYPNDLNACHEFERALKPIQRFEYANALETALDLIPEGQGLGLREHRNFACAHASAEQRCRAFIATMEKGEHHGR